MPMRLLIFVYGKMEPSCTVDLFYKLFGNWDIFLNLINITKSYLASEHNCSARACDVPPFLYPLKRRVPVFYGFGLMG